MRADGKRQFHRGGAETRRRQRPKLFSVENAEKTKRTNIFETQRNGGSGGK